jgi:membrane protein DedA with SNARE-associated domain
MLPVNLNPGELVHDYGYYAVVIGTFFEGELIMLAAGMAACAGFLSLPGVIAAGMLGIFASDTFCFLLGRLAGQRIQVWFPRLFARMDVVFSLMERHEERMLVCFQFFPGLCTVTPVAFGMSRISIARFMALDLAGNASWTLFFSLTGYLGSAAVVQAVRSGGFGELVVCSLAGLAAFSIWRIYRALGKRLIATVR